MGRTAKPCSSSRSVQQQETTSVPPLPLLILSSSFPSHFLTLLRFVFSVVHGIAYSPTNVAVRRREPVDSFAVRASAVAAAAVAAVFAALLYHSVAAPHPTIAHRPPLLLLLLPSFIHTPLPPLSLLPPSSLAGWHDRPCRRWNW